MFDVCHALCNTRDVTIYDTRYTLFTCTIYFSQCTESYTYMLDIIHTYSTYIVRVGPDCGSNSNPTSNFKWEHKKRELFIWNENFLLEVSTIYVGGTTLQWMFPQIKDSKLLWPHEGILLGLL